MTKRHSFFAYESQDGMRAICGFVWRGKEGVGPLPRGRAFNPKRDCANCHRIRTANGWKRGTTRKHEDCGTIYNDPKSSYNCPTCYPPSAPEGGAR